MRSLLVASLLLACSSQQAARPVDAPKANEDVATAAPPPPVPEVKPPAPPAAPPADAPPMAAAPATASITGCLAEPGGQPSRAASGPHEASLTARRDAAGVVITHALQHACCLHGEVTTAVTGDAIHVREELTGTPCRCMCWSEIAVPVSVPSGSYNVTVETVEPGRTTTREAKVER